MKNFDVSSKEALQSMFNVLLEDLNNGKNTKEVGWRSTKELNIDLATEKALTELELLQKNLEGKVRLNFENHGICRELKEEFGLEINQLEYFISIQDDKERLEKAYAVIDRITTFLQSPENWTFVVAIGWWKMLESSGMPALIDEVLNEGFSPEGWTVKAIGSSPNLALELAQQYGEIDTLEDCEGFIKEVLKGYKISIKSTYFYTPPNEKNAEKIKKIFRWQEIREALYKTDIKVLAFLWFLFFSLEYINLFPLSNEYFIKLYEKMWSALEELLDRNPQELLSNLEKKTEILSKKGIPWVSDILRIPEVI